MTGNQWQYIVVFLLLIGIVVWICYNLFSKKRRRRMSHCPSCSMKEVCHKPQSRRQRYDQGCDGNCCEDKKNEG